MRRAGSVWRSVARRSEDRLPTDRRHQPTGRARRLPRTTHLSSARASRPRTCAGTWAARRQPGPSGRSDASHRGGGGERMDALALLHRAQEVGLRIEPMGDTLLVRGPKRAEPVVRLLAEYKAEV